MRYALAAMRAVNARAKVEHARRRQSRRAGLSIRDLVPYLLLLGPQQSSFATANDDNCGTARRKAPVPRVIQWLAVQNHRRSIPIQRPALPGVDQPDDEYPDINQCLDEAEHSQRAQLNRPRVEE